MTSTEEEDVYPLKLPPHTHAAPGGVTTEDPNDTWLMRRKKQRGYKNPPRDSNK